MQNDKQRPISHQIDLEDLKLDPDFREFWAGVLKGIRAYGLNEAVLGFIHRPKKRIGTIDAINAQAALDMHRLEGSLEIWETLLDLTTDPLPVEDEDDNEETELV